MTNVFLSMFMLENVSCFAKWTLGEGRFQDCLRLLAGRHSVFSYVTVQRIFSLARQKVDGAGVTAWWFDVFCIFGVWLQDVLH